MTTRSLGGPRLEQLERITDLVRIRAADDDGVIAVDLAGGQLTVSELDHDADALAAELDHGSLLPGLVVARLPNCLAAAAVVVGVLRSRHALLMVHPELPADVCVGVLGHLGPVAEVTLDGTTLRVLREPYGPGRPIWQPPAARPDLGIALCVLTSGTTGRPRVIAAPHRQVLTAVGLIDARLGYRDDDVVPMVSPLSFDYGLYQLFLTFAGRSVVVLDPRLATVSNLLVAIARTGATVLPLVPTMLRAVTGSPFVRRVDTSAVRLVTTTGDLLTEADAEAAAISFPQAAILPMYGLSECKRVAVTPHDARRPPGAVGLPLDGTDVAVVNMSGARLGAGTTGELVVAGPHLTLGYLDDEIATAKRFAVDPRTGVRLLRTGDRLRIDSDGWLHWVGRSHDLIKTSGYRIDPAEIETAAAASGVLAECGAYGRADPGRGQVPVLRARLRNGVPAEAGLAAITTALAAALPTWSQPRIEIDTVALPHTANGKIDRAALPGDDRPADDAAPDHREQPMISAAVVGSANLINCHTQAILSAFAMPAGMTPELFEIVTTVPFGARTRPSDPHRVVTPWLDPDIGLDRATEVLGLRTVVQWHNDADTAVARLDQWLRTGPVLLGPLDLGSLVYHELADTLRGCDHYVVALGRSDTGHLVVRDPEGYVEVEINEAALRTAWAAAEVPEGRGGYTLRRVAPGDDPVTSSELLARTGVSALANLAAASEAPDGGARGYRALAAFPLDASGRRGLSLLLPSAAARARLAARFAVLAAAALPDASRWRRMAELWDHQVRTLARAHHALLSGGLFRELVLETASLEERLADVATQKWKVNLP